MKSNAITDKAAILGFLKGEIPDPLGRMYSDLLKADDFEMEQCHQHIQWMFPLHEESRMACCYPILSPEIVAEAKQSKVILDNLRLALERLTKFFAIGPYDNYHIQVLWCRDVPYVNHNLLRITRIIRSLRLFGLDEEAG